MLHINRCVASQVFLIHQVRTSGIGNVNTQAVTRGQFSGCIRTLAYGRQVKSLFTQSNVIM